MHSRPNPPLAGPSETPERSVAERPLNTTNLITLISVAILVGTELIALSLAAGWAVAGLFDLGKVTANVLSRFSLSLFQVPGGQAAPFVNPDVSWLNPPK